MPRVTVLRIGGTLVLLVLVAAIAVWIARKPIADAALRRAIAARGVEASYTVKSIGLQWERIENVRIGNPKAPDLTADWAEVRVTAGLGGASLKAVRAEGVRLHGRLVAGRLTLGQIDKLLPKRDDKVPFSLPDIDVDLSDARMRIETPWGQVGGRIDGNGNFSNGFSGKIAAIAPSLEVGGCTARRATAYIDIRIRNREPLVKGPVRVESATCADLAAAKAVLGIDATLGAALDRWRGRSSLQVQYLKKGEATLEAISGKLSFDGNATKTSGTATLAAAAGRIASTRLSNLVVDGRYATGATSSASGRIEIGRLTTAADFIGPLDRAAARAVATPLGPLLAQLATASRQALANISVVADAAFDGSGAAISSLRAKSDSGALFQTVGGAGLRFGATGISADTQIKLSGGGFPAIDSTLRRRTDGMTLGMAWVSPFVGGGTRVVFDRIRFAANTSGAMRFETATVLSGPLGGGRIDELRLPLNATISANGNFIVNNGCTPVAFRAFSMSGLMVDRTALRMCPSDGTVLLRSVRGKVVGGTVVAAPHLTGMVGGTPVDLTANNARFLLRTNSFSVQKIEGQAGIQGNLSRIQIASLDGQVARGGIQGRFADASGKLANVPLLVDHASGAWTFRDGSLALRSNMTVFDAVGPARFNPLTSSDATLNLVNGRIDATATLQVPSAGVEVTKVVIAYNMATGTGTATLAVNDLRFGKSLQPETLTRLTLGVVANVQGAISGRGKITWSPDKVASSGAFETRGLDFAAAFGPVSGLSGNVIFNDLLALATPPGQRVTIASINPGTLVTNGVITYQLLPDQRIAIESGAWPFAGGDLLLDSAMIDMGQETERKLTFRVVGLDAAKFVQQLEFENLAATGTFDGIMPMYFDANGGRIEGGRLVVRRGGGTLAYVGEISNTAMNVYAKLAFDALKSIRYQNLTIALNGPLDGEIVSQINFNGINEAPLSPPKSFIARQFIGLPFVFNIKVTAPFRSLINTARTIQDPSSLLQRTLPEMRAPPVQPPESETKP
jgi:translocation and assembly module TamB